MIEREPIILKDFSVRGENHVVKPYQMVLTGEAFYLIDRSRDYSKQIDALLKGLNTVLEVVEGISVEIGGPLGEMVRQTITKPLKSISKNRPKKDLDNILENLERSAQSKRGVEKILLDDIQLVTFKLGYFIFGSSSLQIKTYEQGNFKLLAKQRKQISDLQNVMQYYAPFVLTETKYF